METNDVIYLQEGSIVRTEKTYDNDVAYFREEAVLDLLTTAYFHSYLNTDMGWDECKAKAEKDARYMINRLKGGKK